MQREIDFVRVIPDITIKFRENGEWIDKTSDDLFYGKRCVIFGLPGAFTPTCSAYQLPGFEEKYDEIKSLGIDEVYCISVNDAFVMNAWAKDQGIQKVKLIPDGNGHFTEAIKMLVPKWHLGFGVRSWRYAAVTKGFQFEWFTEEPGIENSISFDDPYGDSSPESVIEYLKSVA